MGVVVVVVLVALIISRALELGFPAVVDGELPVLSFKVGVCVYVVPSRLSTHNNGIFHASGPPVWAGRGKVGQERGTEEARHSDKGLRV